MNNDDCLFPDQPRYAKMLHDIKIGRKVYAKKDEILKVRYFKKNSIVFWTNDCKYGSLVELYWNSFELLEKGVYHE